MDLTREQRLMLQAIWSVLKDKLVNFTGKTSNRNVTLVASMEIIRNDTLKMFSNYTEEEANIASKFVEVVIDTVLTTTSLQKTIAKVDTLIGGQL
ncbi:MAG: hypothetical protein ACREV6_02115 [Clostridium sp.]|uniref:hypothetical protein n=1 Tax=Clostridium sp. TaxID=1506 RepID=UPI003D6C8046